MATQLRSADWSAAAQQQGLGSHFGISCGVGAGAEGAGEADAEAEDDGGGWTCFVTPDGDDYADGKAAPAADEVVDRSVGRGVGLNGRRIDDGVRRAGGQQNRRVGRNFVPILMSSLASCSDVGAHLSRHALGCLNPLWRAPVQRQQQR